MKNMVILLLCFSCMSLQDVKKKYIVKGKLSETRQYCGGAVPNPEILKALETPKVIAGKKLYVRKGKVNDPSAAIVAQAITDTAGNFSFQLPNGTYCLLSDTKKDKLFYDQLLKDYSKKSDFYGPIDKACLDEWLKTPDMIFEVKGADITITHNYHIPCSWNKIPCTTYTGPMPP